jgi:hypothetical protein
MAVRVKLGHDRSAPFLGGVTGTMTLITRCGIERSEILPVCTIEKRGDIKPPVTSAGITLPSAQLVLRSRLIRAHIDDYFSCHFHGGNLHICLVLWCHVIR